MDTGYGRGDQNPGLPQTRGCPSYIRRAVDFGWFSVVDIGGVGVLAAGRVGGHFFGCSAGGLAGLGCVRRVLACRGGHFGWTSGATVSSTCREAFGFPSDVLRRDSPLR